MVLDERNYLKIYLYTRFFQVKPPDYLYLYLYRASHAINFNFYLFEPPSPQKKVKNLSGPRGHDIKDDLSIENKSIPIEKESHVCSIPSRTTPASIIHPLMINYQNMSSWNSYRQGDICCNITTHHHHTLNVSIISSDSAQTLRVVFRATF